MVQVMPVLEEVVGYVTSVITLKDLQSSTYTSSTEELLGASTTLLSKIWGLVGHLVRVVQRRL